MRARPIRCDANMVRHLKSDHAGHLSQPESGHSGEKAPSVSAEAMALSSFRRFQNLRTVQSRSAPTSLYEQQPPGAAEPALLSPKRARVEMASNVNEEEKGERVSRPTEMFSFDDQRLSVQDTIMREAVEEEVEDMEMATLLNQRKSVIFRETVHMADVSTSHAGRHALIEKHAIPTLVRELAHEDAKLRHASEDTLANLAEDAGERASCFFICCTCSLLSSPTTCFSPVSLSVRSSHAVRSTPQRTSPLVPSPRPFATSSSKCKWRMATRRPPIWGADPAPPQPRTGPRMRWSRMHMCLIRASI